LKRYRSAITTLKIVASSTTTHDVLNTHEPDDSQHRGRSKRPRARARHGAPRHDHCAAPLTKTSPRGSRRARGPWRTAEELSEAAAERLAELSDDVSDGDRDLGSVRQENRAQ